jgi:hypothetical protein
VNVESTRQHRSDPNTTVNRFLYHGTHLRNLESVLARGLYPRGTAPSNWPDQPSRPDCVYLTASQGFAYGRDNNEDEKVAVFEVELASLDKRLLYPDEDFIADCLAHQPGSGGTYHDLLPVVLTNISSYKKYWKESIEGMGSVAHRGPIPVEAISRYCTVDFRQRQNLSLVCEGSVSSIWQYHALKDQFSQDTQWFFGDVSEHYHASLLREHCKIAGAPSPEIERGLRVWLKESADRTGITVVKVK